MPESIKRASLVYLAMEGADYIVPEKMDYGVKRTPQLGLMYLSSVLKNLGVSCRIMDQSVLNFNLAELSDHLKQDQVDLVGFYADTYLKPRIHEWIHALKAMGVNGHFIVGGPGSFDAEGYIDAGAEFVCHGEGERTIEELIEYYSGKKKLAELRGVSYREGGKMIETRPQELIEDLDSILLPDRGQFAADTYFDYHYFGMRQPYTSMLASRGCPNRCSFCASSAILGRKVRQRSVDNVLAEIDRCRADFGLKYIGFKDDIFSMKTKWAEEFSEGLISRKAPVKYAVNLYPFSFKNKLEETLSTMKRAGLDQVVVGLQSVDPQVLKNINRHPDEPERVAEITRVCKKLGVTVVVEFIFGLPGDNDHTMKSALDYSLSHRPNYALFYVLSVLDGSQIKKEFGLKGPSTGFSNEQLRQRCADYQKKFFLKPGMIFQNLLHILLTNPMWFARMMLHWRYLLGAVGFKKKRKAAEKTFNL